MLDRAPERVHQPGGVLGCCLRHPEDGDDHILPCQLEVDVVVLVHQLGHPVAARSGATDVDRQSQRVVAGDPGPSHDALVDHVEAG